MLSRPEPQHPGAVRQPPRSKSLRLAFGLAVLAILGTVLLGALVWLRLHFLRYHAFPFAAPIFLLNIAINDPDFSSAVRWLLGCNAACCLGALWLALRR